MSLRLHRFALYLTGGLRLGLSLRLRLRARWRSRAGPWARTRASSWTRTAGSSSGIKIQENELHKLDKPGASRSLGRILLSVSFQTCHSALQIAFCLGSSHWSSLTVTILIKMVISLSGVDSIGSVVTLHGLVSLSRSSWTSTSRGCTATSRSTTTAGSTTLSFGSFLHPPDRVDSTVMWCSKWIKRPTKMFKVTFWNTTRIR